MIRISVLQNASLSVLQMVAFQEFPLQNPTCISLLPSRVTCLGLYTKLDFIPNKTEWTA